MRHYIQLIFLVVCCLSLGNAQSQCLTPDQRQGSCIELRQCTRLLNLIRDPNLSITDQNYLRNSECARTNNHQRWVCCSPDDGPQESSSNPPLTSNTRGDVQGNRRGLSVNDLPEPGVCGSSLDNRVTFGEPTKINEFPWMVLIQYTKSNSGKGFHCGGVLINKDYILTASHCVNGRGVSQLGWVPTGVRLGEWDLSNDDDCDDGYCSEPVLDIPVVERIPHENYKSNSKTQENDIALLRLARSITFTDWIKPICLPISPGLTGKNYDNSTFIVSGWGRTENVFCCFPLGTNSNIKLKAEVDGVPINQCNNVYRERNVMLTDKQLCAGGGVSGKDSCKGDSGGPLMTKHNPDPYHMFIYLAGLVSFGPWPCGLAGWPGVYTRVDQYTDWILSHMRA
ncbi:serine protease easter-like [Sitodiplosis mosellana]|uniref:serine protease easter-like n=1 Tax=Sitodiplosis mosellana TaxID=263140 RepID=UPI002443874A|nr:serine protease easter-like [Sitodiplosis mosellana]